MRRLNEMRAIATTYPEQWMKVVAASATIQPDDLRHRVEEETLDFVQLLVLFG
jgi:hypothetical protein